MPRRHVAPKTYYRCAYCGALVPSKYECTCNETQVFKRIHELFPGTVEEPCDFIPSHHDTQNIT